MTAIPDSPVRRSDAATAAVKAATPEPRPAPAPDDAPQSEPTVEWGAAAPGRWFVQEEAVVGLAHRNKNLPCQDSAQAVNRPRTALVVADGAGSSAVSELGARAVVRSTIRLLDTLDKPLSAWLDGECAQPEQEARNWSLLLVKHAIGVLNDLAAEHRRELRDFRCTLLLAVMGQQRLFWLKIGDGAIVLEQRRMQLDGQGQPSWTYELATLGRADKGEFANQTLFLDAATPADVQIGCLEIGPVSGLALMSDGAAERLVANDGSRVAPRVSRLLAQLRQDKLRRSVLTRMFYEDEFCERTSGDDRSIALAACENPAFVRIVPAPASPAVAAPEPQAEPQAEAMPAEPLPKRRDATVAEPQAPVIEAEPETEPAPAPPPEAAEPAEPEAPAEPPR